MDEKYDNEFYEVLRQSAARVRDAAIQDGQDLTNAPLYPNYAMFDVPLIDMYGGNVDRLRSLRRKVDPPGRSPSSFPLTARNLSLPYHANQPL